MIATKQKHIRQNGKLLNNEKCAKRAQKWINQQ